MDVLPLSNAQCLLILTRTIESPHRFDGEFEIDLPVPRLQEVERLIAPSSRCSTLESTEPSECTDFPREDGHGIMIEKTKDPFDDCWAASLEFLGNAKDFEHFRRTTKRFDRIHDEYRKRKVTKFLDFQVLFQNDSHQGKYRDVADLIRRVPLIPDVFARFDDLSNIGNFKRLHRRSKKYILRGLTAGSHDPFLSVLLWNDLDVDEITILLVLTVPSNHEPNVRVYGQSRRGTGPMVFNPRDFGVVEFNDLLYRKIMYFSVLEDQAILEELSCYRDPLWSIGRRRCGFYVWFKCARYPCMGRVVPWIWRQRKVHLQLGCLICVTLPAFITIVLMLLYGNGVYQFDHWNI